MKTIYTFSHPVLDYTYRDFPSVEVAENHRIEVGKDLGVSPEELVIESFQVSDAEFDELMEYAGFYA